MRMYLKSALVILACSAVTASAQQLDPGISCLEGSVPANDWAELNSKYKPTFPK